MAEMEQMKKDNIQQRLNSGRALYKANGGTLGRNAGAGMTKEKLEEKYDGVIKLIKQGYPVRKIAKLEDVGISTVMRVKKALCL